MRCVVRIILLTCFIFIAFIYLAVSYANSKIVVAFDANDEEARRILDSAIPSPTVASPFNNTGPQSMSVSVALVLIVSLISVALLITGIIIIAVTLDPTSNSEEDEESDLEIDEPSNPTRKKDKQIADPNSYYPRFDYDFNNSNTILSELFSVEVEISEEGTARASEREHREWDWDWHVDSDLSDIDFIGELSGGGTVAGEDGGSVSVWVVVDNFDSFVEVLSFHDNNKNGWSNKVSIFKSWNSDIGTIEWNLCSLLSCALDKTKNASLGMLGDKWSNISIWFPSSINLQVLSFLHELWEPGTSLSDEDGGGESHATLSSGSESGSGELIKSLLLVGISHDDSMVFGSHVGLNAFSVLGSTLVDVLSLKWNYTSIYFCKKLTAASPPTKEIALISGLSQINLLGEFNKKLSCSWVLLRWLDDHGVSSGQSNWEHPKWDHSWEVEWADSSSDSEWNSVGVCIHIARNIWKSLSHHERWNGASVLDNLKTSANISLSIWKRFSLLNGDALSKFLHVSLDKSLKFEHALLTTTLTPDQTATLESPCSPMIHPWQEDGAIFNFSDSKKRKRAESRLVPDPKTRSRGSPDSFQVT
ncbi:hypothetical protein GCK72_005566 [Caenorhabditis remanei]|uniref:Uncharacterized protein n=1 Tax=Caenorhabditis remanei TaxID=31234 RepID=A0A6A5HGW5_CAERE|nr:hypothetical protein GCK72_005566 [Caenorhabditis remanei]KAF1765613.1 hypothetical protein GCK72_005566 [Caenorhabditis remanei]